MVLIVMPYLADMRDPAARGKTRVAVVTAKLRAREAADFSRITLPRLALYNFIGNPPLSLLTFNIRARVGGRRE